MAFGIFKKKKADQSTTDSRYFDVTIKSVIPVAKDAVNVVFEKPENGFSYEPGQFITIIDEVGGRKIRRAYSLCTSPAVDEHPAVTVKRVKDGLMSNHVNDSYQSGMNVQLMEPMGMFTTDYVEDRSRDIVLIGGGSGITPLYSILKTLLVKETKTKVSLVYGNRSEDYIIFKKELQQLAKQHSNFELVFILEESNGQESFLGRPDENMVGQIVDKLGMDKETQVFICGPQPMMDVFSSGLNKNGIEASQVMIESFEAGKTAPSEVNQTSEATGGDVEATIVLNGESFSLSLDKDKGILEQALAKELDMPYSCQSGLCTACRGKCLEGEVSVNEAMGLSDSEMAEGYVLTCVGKPLSDRIKIEMG